MKWLGLSDTPAGRGILTEHFAQVTQTPDNIVRSFANQYGNFEVRESLFVGPSGKAVKLQTTYQVLQDGTRRFSTTIPFRLGN
ncbi:hypothetical protein B7R77_10265 [Ralstonia solanacearum K60]|uniref:Uncharacterized protein n=3 Tax=Ralstonia solanacearum TaxID=305 RepID=A0AAP7ZN18_RALSL|nr:hypothetical protein B7R77_10265 [Ralstonia solanacearum K60]